MTPIPSMTTPLTQEYAGLGNGVTPEWYRYWQSWSGLPEVGVNVPVSVSPTRYTAPASGAVFVSGGTVSGIAISRGRATFATGATQGCIPVAKGDTLTVTYTLTPTIAFLPS